MSGDAKAWKGHTPGPWRAGGFGIGSVILADSPVPGIGGSDDVAYYGGHLIAESVAPQNAALIAAAPELAAEVARLRAVLRAIADDDDLPPNRTAGCRTPEEHWQRTLDWHRDLARGALSDTPEQPA